MPRTIVVIMAAAALLPACAALPNTASAPAPESPLFSASINVRKVSGWADAGARLPADMVPALTEAMRAEFAKEPQAGPAANLVFTIAEYRPAGRRAKAASMTVKVSITTPAGSALRQFAVTREAEGPGAEARARLIAQTAEAVAKAVRGEAPPS